MTQSAVLTGLHLMMSDFNAPIPPLAEEALEGCREFARRGIPLELVLRGVRLGHAHLTRGLAAGVEEHVPADQRLAEMRRIEDLLFTYVDAHSSVMAEEYIAERDRWRGSDEAARRAVIDEVLAGRPVDQEAAALRLRYDLSRTHVAAVLWSDGTASSAPAAEHLYRAASNMARALETARTLIVPAHDNDVWAWFAVGGENADDLIRSLPSSLPQPAGVRAALGPPAPGPRGMRRSHMGALQAQRMALRGSEYWLCDYRNIRLAALVTADSERARWFVQEVLGPLAAEGGRLRELRETLRIYLAEGRSPRTAAERLHIARNTVTYRVKRAEELLPTATTALSSLELRVALEIANASPTGTSAVN
ncbi:PucR family transcriptional regulator [Streptomyces sp. AM8-1-1]|uniref:PucR family transcriptional regulator n=1 Tax=Streptomyces sp. AM8-1-1 TaxID=3075825 RepID=UPI0028C4BB05|nr:helix-turn-helix domain-containing protein [Streptomyces sp. AM8-1-1]WNO76885.1 helix-turn-helix domain-containing protein [Streptomyces sp. AM8-1-1]